VTVILLELQTTSMSAEESTPAAAAAAAGTDEVAAHLDLPWISLVCTHTLVRNTTKRKQQHEDQEARISEQVLLLMACSVGSR
jgi:hypothetical protein